MSPSQPMRRSPEPFDSRVSDKRDVGAELDNIFRLGSPAQERETLERNRPPAPPAASSETRRFTQGDLDAALEMLNRAAQAMDILQARYHQVESYARDIAGRAERDLAVAHDQKKEWEARALGSEARLDETKLRLEHAQKHVEAADRRASEAERLAEQALRRAEQAERGAVEANDWLECFRDKIVASFDTRPFPRSVAA